MILDILARSQVRLARSVQIGSLGQLVHLIGRHRPARHLGPDHVHACLPLRVDAPPQTLGSELIVVDLARYPLLGRGAKRFNVLPHGVVVLSFQFSRG